MRPHQPPWPSRVAGLAAAIVQFVRDKMRERFTERCPWRRSTSLQRSPRSSPRRMPVFAASQNAGKSRSPCTVCRKAWSCAAVQERSSSVGRRRLGASASAAMLGTTRPRLHASRRALCRTTRTRAPSSVRGRPCRRAGRWRAGRRRAIRGGASLTTSGPRRKFVHHPGEIGGRDEGTGGARRSLFENR